MSFFPRSFIEADTPATSFHPLFRLLDDFDNYNQTSKQGGSQVNRQTHPQQPKFFTPKFDVRELQNAYELHGELPGIDQKDVSIEFTDENTLTVRGRSERSYTAGTPPQGFIESAEEPQQQKQVESHKATAEDDPSEPATPPPEGSQVTTQQQQAENKEQELPQAKYWVSERSVGEFARSFTFPGRVDHDGVTASMKNGILAIVVPKAKKHETRKIAISF